MLGSSGRINNLFGFFKNTSVFPICLLDVTSQWTLRQVGTKGWHLFNWTNRNDDHLGNCVKKLRFLLLLTLILRPYEPSNLQFPCFRQKWRLSATDKADATCASALARLRLPSPRSRMTTGLGMQGRGRFPGKEMAWEHMGQRALSPPATGRYF